MLSLLSLLSVSLFALQSNAQGFVPGLTNCGVFCGADGLNAFAKYGCASNTDYACLCTKNDFLFALRDCVQQSCPADEQGTNIGVFDETCPGHNAQLSITGVSVPTSFTATVASTSSSSASSPSSSSASTSTSVSASTSSSASSQTTAATPATTSAVAQATASESALTTYTGTYTAALVVSGNTLQTSYTFVSTSTISDAGAYASLLASIAIASASSAAGSQNQSSNSSSSSDNSGLSMGAKIGIGVGVGVGVPLIALAAFFLFRANRNRATAKQFNMEKSAAAQDEPMQFQSLRYQT